MKRLKNNRGVAFVATLLFAVVLYALSGVFLLRAVHENNMARMERSKMASFYSSQAGAHAALEMMDTLMNQYLLNTISAASPSGVISFANSKVNSGDGMGWLTYAVRHNNNPVLTVNGDQAEYSQSGAAGAANYTYYMTFTEKDDPASAGTDAWDFPFNYEIIAQSQVENTSSQIQITGDFNVRLQKDNFAKFALFTNSQSLPSGTNVWFTDKTNFAGPVHTNNRFNFALNPSGTFEDVISQQEQQARFYNWGSPVLIDDDHNGTRDVPVFHDTFTRAASAITLNSSVVKQDMIDQAVGGQTYSSDGIYVPNNGSQLLGGIYVLGDSNISMSVNGSSQAVYTLQQGSSTKIITVDHVNQETSVEDVSAGNTVTYTGLPDGIDDAGTLIYVDGEVESLAGTVQSDTQLTIASTDDVKITNHVQYESFTPAAGQPGDPSYVPPHAQGAANLLGIVTWEGDVRIGTAAPDDLNIHGSLLASSGIFQVDSYNDTGRGGRGTATLLGGLISDNYGAFGLFNGSTGQQIAGYGRNFVYDSRMQTGTAPPYFPTLNTFIAFTNDITDKMVWQEGE